ncbi:hypothetical protein HU200_050214 [Digitaria exilis]|uniref:SHSP domain-containing protein n=1 Tax=Digitaria exilis TaxID=1010633 RepID=A0A835AUU8_9POAL|nr:hypothetical protein HU200_050214 [Digitaria exilis]CAB3473411.1 unnamed protein product [Digitaria exilis]
MASSQAPAVADDLIHEWLDDGDTYLLRLNLPGFKKEDFRVHVDVKGRLTVIGQRRTTLVAGDGKAVPVRIHKVFQLPNTANLDTITGRFDGTVLTLTVPKLPLQQQRQQNAAAAAAEPARVAATADGEKQGAQAEDKAPHQKTSQLTARDNKEEDAKAKPVAPPPPPPLPETEKTMGGGGGDGQDDEKARAEHREKVEREAARRIEAARARVAEAKAKAERERQCEQWKERATEEGLKLADAVSRNKEVIATAVAAFTLGVFLSTKLFSRS